MEKSIVKAVLETSNNILLEIYGDLLKPGVAQVGKAIGTIIGLGNTILMPLALKNEQSKIILESNLDKYRQKLEQIPEENIQAVIPEIGVPVLEKLMYVSDETLVELYTELLAKASDKEKCESTHPSFVNIINNLSPKESQLLNEIDKKDVVAIVDVNVVVDGAYKPCEQISEFVLNDEFYDNNITAYLSNLSGLGLIEINLTRNLKDLQRYELLENKIKMVYKNSPLSRDNKVFFHMRNGDLEFTRGCITITSFGELFLIACTKKTDRFEIYDAFYSLSEL